MRASKLLALAIVVAAPTLISLSPALAASECPASGTLSGWGVNSTGYFNLQSGGTCLFPIKMDGHVNSSSVSQKPEHGTLKRLNISTYQYTAKSGYKGNDTFAVTATGKGPAASGTSVITMNAAVQ